MKSFLLCNLLVLLVATSCKKDANQLVKSGDSSATVSTLAGSTSGYADGQGTLAKFAVPHGISVDMSGNIYVADNNNQRIRKITPSGTVTTFAGSTLGNTNGTGANAQFNYPEGLAGDATGNIYVVDSENHSIRKITPDGIVSTFTGINIFAGHLDGSLSTARFNNPTSITLTNQGVFYITDNFNFRIRKISK